MVWNRDHQCHNWSLLSNLGYDVTAVTGRPEQHEYLRALGASAFLSRAEMSEVPKPLEGETWGGAVDTVGSTMLAKVLAQRLGDARDLGDIVAREVDRTPGRDPGAAVYREVERYSLELRDAVEAVLARGSMPCVLGGDHSLGAATQAAVGRHARRAGWEAPGIIWIDAHTDSNTMETTPSGNLHGMMLAAVHGLDVPPFRSVVEGGLRDPRRTVFVGARDIDDEEYDMRGRGRQR